jgi:photosystem II stability/assembly factor-like uncharacterized protein
MIAHPPPAAMTARSPASDLASLPWRSIGPFRGGRVLAVEGAPDSPLHFYFGAVNGGVWETRDAGRTWNPIFDAAPVGSIGALAVAPTAANIIYVGTGEADMRSDIAQGLGMYRSADGGKSWTASGLADSRQIARILVDPRDPKVVLVAALGHPYGPNEQRGVFRSTDGGVTWTQTLFKNADTGAVDLAFKPGDPDTVYAALWQTRRPPWSVYPPSDGPGGGLYKSTDGGRTWSPLTGAGLPAAVGRIGLAVSPAAPERLYALIDAKDAGGLYRSDDSGATWTKVSGDKRIWQRGWYFGGVTVNPKNPDELWVCDTIVLHSIDAGRTFIPLKGDPTGDDFHQLWIDPANPDRRILGVDQGTLVTLNGGTTWSSWFNQPTGQFYHVVTDDRFPYNVYGAQQDSGAASVPSRTGGQDGINMTQFHEQTPGGESDNIAPDPDDPDLIYGGRVDKLDLRSGQVKNVDPTLAFPGKYRDEWTLPLVFGKRDHALYFGNQKIFRTVDGGAHWTPISPDLTRPDPGVPPNLDPPTAADTGDGSVRKGVVYAIGPSPIAAGDVWAGTDDGLVWRTRDGGAHWSDVTPAGLPAWSKTGVVEPSHFDANRAYIAVDRHRLDDQAPYVYRTIDSGTSWTPIARGLADGGELNAVNVVREDPVRPGLLFAGTERGAFVSLDDGGRWTPLGRGLPTTSVRDIEVHGDDVVIATHGRGFYVLDDIEPLRELAGGAREGTHLFAPATAIRVRPADFTGTPMPKDEPMAPNPPNGADIDYRLAIPPKGPVEIAILDPAGARVRAFSSADIPPAPDLGKIDTAPEWIDRPAPPAATIGLHRFVWDFHYPPPAGIESEQPVAGVWAPPGRYTVTLTVDGQTWRQPLTVAPDPRVAARPADYQRAFELARRIEADRVRAHAALAKAKSEPLAAVTARIDQLAQAVDGADGAPTPDAESGYNQASAALDALLVKP